MREDELDLIKKYVVNEIDYESITKLVDDENIYYLETQKDGFSAAYLIYFCDGNRKFSYDTYIKANELIENDEDKTAYYTSVFVFDDLDKETEQFDNEYDKLKEGKKRAYLKSIFSTKNSIYRNNPEINMLVEDGINYLSYSCSNDMKGYVYSISYKELQRLFVIKGRDLFRENIRYGIVKDNAAKKKLRANFTGYLYWGFCNYLNKNEKLSEENCKKILDVCGIVIDKNNKDMNPEMFWFKHNGVTVYVMDGKLNRKGNSIGLNAENVSIINGAQTITNLYSVIHELKRNCKSLCNKSKDQIFIDVLGKLNQKNIDKEKFISKFIDEIFDSICKDIRIKTIFILGNQEIIREISDGLNTQLPIDEVDIIANSNEVNDLNEKLVTEGIRIIKEGEIEDKYNIKVLSFAKYYKMICLNPGTSKNLNKNKVDKLIEEAGKQNNIAHNMKIAIMADHWWANNSNRVLNSSKYKYAKALASFGRNYFISYVMLRNQETYDDDTFSVLCIELARDIEQINTEKTYNEFKKDQLFEEIKEVVNNYKENNKHDIKIDSDNNSIIDYINNNEEITNDSVIESLVKYYSDNNISISGLKTLFVKNDEVISEYCFTEESFAELSSLCDSNDDLSYFKNSKFYKELVQKSNIFIVTINNDNKCSEVKLIKDFSFESVVDKAEQIYNDTAQKFYEGIEEFEEDNELPFYLQANDSGELFTYTNGNDICLHHFVAGRKLLHDLLLNYSE